MPSHEEKMTMFLRYPHDTFLMLRYEFLIICQDELEAKLLRIIEHHSDLERKRVYRETVHRMKAAPHEVVEITRDIWVPLSYKLFMSELYGMVTSENTIKKALKSLMEKKIIFRRHTQQQRYDAPAYKIHVPVLQMLLDEVGKPGYQNMIPSIIEALKKLDPHEMTPSECQEVIPSIAPLSTSRVSKNDTTYNKVITNKDSQQERESAPTSHTPGPLSPDALAQVTAPSHALASLQEALAQLSEQDRTALLAQYGLPAQAKARNALNNVAPAPHSDGVVQCSPESESESEPEPPDTVPKARRNGVVVTRLPPALRDLSEPQETQDAKPSDTTPIPVATDTDTSMQGALAPSRRERGPTAQGDMHPASRDGTAVSLHELMHEPLSEQMTWVAQDATGHPRANEQTGHQDHQGQQRQPPDPNASGLLAMTAPAHVPAHTGASGARQRTSSKPTLTLQGQHIWDVYQSFKKRRLVVTQECIRAANGLGEVVEQDQDFLDVLEAITQDRFLKERRVRWDLDFVYRKYDGFLDTVESNRAKLATHEGRSAHGAPERLVAATPGSQVYVDALLDAFHENFAHFTQSS